MFQKSQQCVLRNGAIAGWKWKLENSCFSLVKSFTLYVENIKQTLKVW